MNMYILKSIKTGEVYRGMAYSPDNIQQVLKKRRDEVLESEYKVVYIDSENKEHEVSFANWKNA